MQQGRNSTIAFWQILICTDKLQLMSATDKLEIEPHFDLAQMRSEEYCNSPGSGKEIDGLEG